MRTRALIRAPGESPRPLKLLVTARILSSVPILVLLFDGFTTLLNGPAVRQAHARLGYPASLGPNLGLLIVACTVIYAVQRTSVVGALLLTGYLGGATALHLRAGEPSYFPVLLTILLWAGLYLRDERLRAFILEGDDAEP